MLELAKNYGLNFGAVASHLDGKSGAAAHVRLLLSVGSGVSKIPSSTCCMSPSSAAHKAYARPRNLTAAEIETLSLVKNGLLMKEIASLLGISESAIKQRLKNARLKLNAKTGPQAAATATMLGMI